MSKKRTKIQQAALRAKRQRRRTYVRVAKLYQASQPRTVQATNASYNAALSVRGQERGSIEGDSWGRMSRQARLSIMRRQESVRSWLG
jgi:hypothetical protein